MAYDGECFSGTFDGESEEVCTGDQELGSAGALTDGLAGAELTIVTVERDGAWYVTPTRTFFDYGLAVLRALEPEDLEDPEAFFSERFGFSPFLFGTGSAEETDSGSALAPADGTDPFAECTAVYDELPADATDEQYAEADSTFDECYDRIAGVDAGAGVDAEAPDPFEECSFIYDELSPDATEDAVVAADEAYGECYDEVVGEA